MRLTTDQRNAYRKYTIDAITDYDGNTPQNPVKYLFEVFYDEFGWNVQRQGEMNALKEWLQGVPSVIHLPMWYNEQIELAKKFGSIPQNATEKDEQKIIDNFYNFFANILIQLHKKEK